mmetsp:Transcript_17378/g.41868  ORF Transcript_17378/g.41868 Transcript_17378/m.41868 type:complete len:201 (-) Transcript_17378:290-892(-)
MRCPQRTSSSGSGVSKKDSCHSASTRFRATGLTGPSSTTSPRWARARSSGKTASTWWIPAHSTATGPLMSRGRCTSRRLRRTCAIATPGCCGGTSTSPPPSSLRVRQDTCWISWPEGRSGLLGSTTNTALAMGSARSTASMKGRSSFRTTHATPTLRSSWGCRLQSSRGTTRRATLGSGSRMSPWWSRPRQNTTSTANGS